MKESNEQPAPRQENIFGDTNLLFTIMILFLLNMLQYIMRDQTQC